MYATSDAYRTAVYDVNSTIDVYVSIGTGVDQTAADDITSITGGMLMMSNVEQLVDAVYTMTQGLATYEGYGIPTASAEGIICPPLEAVHYPPETGMWSDVISDGTGAMDWTFKVTLSQAHKSAFSIYTDGPSITSGTVTYSLAGVETTVALRCSDGVAMLSRVVEFDALTVHVTGIDESYHHVRVVEIEFGASITFSNEDLADEMTVIEEIDPTEASSPLWELDWKIVNVEGDYDLDNPSTRIGEVKIGTPLTLGFTVRATDGTSWTIPCGRYLVASHTGTETTLDIAAYDARYPLTTLYAEWSIYAATSLGQSIDDLLTAYDVPHLVDEDLYSVYPDADHTFDNSTVISTDLLHIQQAYAIYCIPDRDGSIHVTSVWPGSEYGTIPAETLYQWPTAQQTTLYNYVSVAWEVTDGTSTTTYYVERDLRTDATEGKTILQISGNPLLTEARATTLLNRIIGRLYTEETETEYTGDPAMDLGDTVQIPGLWTEDAPRTYVPIYKEVSFDGTYSATIRGTR